MTRRDILEAAWEIATGIALAVASTLLLLWCSGCATPPPRSVVDLPPQTDLERAAAATTLAEWSAAGLPAPRRDCRVAELRIEEPATQAAYAARCPWYDGKTFECLRWRDMAPVAVMHPALARDRVGAHAQHALLHMLVRCTELTHSDDLYDGGHRLRQVWEVGGAASVETRAERRLYKPP